MKKIYLFLLLASAAFYGCNSSSANQSDPASAGSADKKTAASDDLVAPINPNGQSVAVGSVLKVSATQLDLDVNDQTQSIGLSDAVRIYATAPSSLAGVKSSSYIGVATKKQGGIDRAAQILIFPEELRGLNEGSFMLPGDKNDDGGRMTNGSASAGSGSDDSGSKMSNGSVEKTDGTSLTVQYQGHSRTVTVPPNTPVVEYKITDRKLNTGDKVLVLVGKGSNGASQASKILFL